MTVIDRNWALAQFRHLKNSAILTLAGMHMVNSDQVLALRGKIVVLTRKGIIGNPAIGDRQGARFEVDLGQLTREYTEAHADLTSSLWESWKLSRRAMIKEGYEVTQAYAEAADVMPQLRAQPWYQFARIIRNCLSHDFHFRFNKHDLKNLPVSWEGKEINASLNDADLPSDFLDPHTTWALFCEMTAFVQNN